MLALLQWRFFWFLSFFPAIAEVTKMDDFGLVFDRFEFVIFTFDFLFLFFLEVSLVDGDLGVGILDFVK
jgi:hypothetical protein